MRHTRIWRRYMPVRQWWKPFGEAGFEPVNAAAAFSLSEKQEKLLLSYSNEAMQIVDAYIPGTETSFTIIAFPASGDRSGV